MMNQPNNVGPNSMYGTPTYGPFPDGTVQTHFSYSAQHTSHQHPYAHVDLYLKQPSPRRDQVIQHWDGLPSR